MSTKNAPSQRKSSGGWLDNYFELSARGTTVAREIRGGLVTFFTMAYILFLNPLILSGPDSTGAFLGGGDGPNIPAIAAGTALIAGIMSILMGSVANFPIALAAGMGLNAIVANQLVKIPGMTWADGMGIIALEGIIIALLVITGLREAIFRAVPRQLKTAISVGIGLFIAFVGLVNAGVIRPGVGTPTNLGIHGSLASWPIFLFFITFILMVALYIRRVQGAILIAILAGTVGAIIMETFAKFGPQGGPKGNPAGWALTVPQLSGSAIAVPDFSTFGQVSLIGPFHKIGIVAVLVLVFSVMLADFFDTMGTMVAVGSEGDLLDDDGNPPRTQSILLVDSVGATLGGLGGVSSNTAYIESASGVGEGARTGLASIVTGVTFLLSTFLSPLVALVPNEAATPALLLVGFMMMTQITEISWKETWISIPAFLTIVFMPLGYSITEGIGMGFVGYALLSALSGRAKHVHKLMWGVAVLFVVYFLLGPIQAALSI